MADKNYPNGSGITLVEAAGLDANDFVFMGTSLAGDAQKTKYSELVAAFGGSRRNLLINANPIVNQRVYVSGTATSTNNQYTLDRWRVVTSGQNLTFSDSEGKRTMTAPAGGLEQIVEGTWLQSGTYCISWEGTATCTVGGTARINGEAFSVTGGSNLSIIFSGGTVANPQLEIGGIPTPFDWQPFDTELQRCLFYYEKSYPMSTTPGSSISAGDQSCHSAISASAVNFCTMFYRSRKRGIPTISIWDYAGTLNSCRMWIGGTAAYQTIAVSQILDVSFLVQPSGLTGLTAGIMYQAAFHWVADAELTS